MRRIAIAALIGVAACVSPNPAAFCDSTAQCASSQVCDPSAHLCVLPSAPSIEIDHPTASEYLTGSTGQVTGVVNATPGISIATDYSVGSGVLTPFTTLPSGAFTLNFDLPPLDSQTLPVLVEASDPRNTAQQLIYPLVDNVAPTAAVSPVDGSRGTAPEVIVLFSEPVTGAPALLIPDAGAQGWNADQTVYRFSRLQPNTPYLLALDAGAVSDLAGNPIDGGLRVAFTTAPATPTNGTVLSFGGTVVTDFDSAADEDGVVSVAAVLQTAPETIAWGTFDVSTGAFSVRGQLLSSATELGAVHVAATSRTQAPLPPRRFVSVFTDTVLNSIHAAGWGIDSAVQAATQVTAVIPEPAAPCEPSGDSVGIFEPLDGGIYYLRGTETLGIAAAPRWVALDAPSHWEVFDISGSQMRRIVFTPDCHFAHLDSQPIPSNSLSSQSTFSVALTETGRRIYSYQTSVSIDDCYECDADGGSCVAKNTTIEPSSSAQALVVASMHSGGKVLGTQKQLDGSIALVSRDLSSDDTCGAWSPLGTLPSSNIIKSVPVMFGYRPGAVYLDGDHALHIYIP